ncbi:MAG: hypothetical protein E7254_02450 [Lachnospiraceae bacterium]|nr:hypothetical protein [Lachnospiraceae bacterium]
MEGAINYLRAVSRICKENSMRCESCPIGASTGESVNRALCPRLLSPYLWDDEKTTNMVRASRRY